MESSMAVSQKMVFKFFNLLNNLENNEVVSSLKTHFRKLSLKFSSVIWRKLSKRSCFSLGKTNFASFRALENFHLFSNVVCSGNMHLKCYLVLETFCRIWKDLPQNPVPSTQQTFNKCWLNEWMNEWMHSSTSYILPSSIIGCMCVSLLITE